MTGAGLMNFLIALVELALICGLSWLALAKIAPDEWFNQIGRYAIGGAALLAFLFAIKAVLFGGAGAVTFGPEALIEFAIGLIVLVVVVWLIYMGVDYFAPAPLSAPIKYALAGSALFGGGLGMIPSGTLRLGR